MLDTNLLEFLIHIMTSIIIALVVVVSYLIIRKFQGGLVSKFFKYIVIGSIPIILHHIIENTSFFEVVESGVFEDSIEHSTVIFLYLMILIGTVIVYRDYKSLRVLKKQK